MGSRGAAGAEGDDGCHAVGEERTGKGDAGVEVLADEEVAVVKGSGVDPKEELVWAGCGV